MSPARVELRLDPVEVFPLPQLGEINLVKVMGVRGWGIFCLTQGTGVNLIKGHKFVWRLRNIQ